jgi:hypothetical protein
VNSSYHCIPAQAETMLFGRHADFRVPIYNAIVLSVIIRSHHVVLPTDGCDVTEHQNRRRVLACHQYATMPHRVLYFHFCTTTPPRLNSDMSPRACALSVNSLEGNVVISAYSRSWLAGLARATKS